MIARNSRFGWKRGRGENGTGRRNRLRRDGRQMRARDRGETNRFKRRASDRRLGGLARLGAKGLAN